jgi:hypothetical protein
MAQACNGFQLQFAAAQIKQLAARYRYDDDTEALEVGHRIACGDYSRANLEVIFRWKTGGRGIRVFAAIQTLKSSMRYDWRLMLTPRGQRWPSSAAFVE